RFSRSTPHRWSICIWIACVTASIIGAAYAPMPHWKIRYECPVLEEHPASLARVDHGAVAERLYPRPRLPAPGAADPGGIQAGRRLETGRTLRPLPRRRLVAAV